MHFFSKLCVDIENKRQLSGQGNLEENGDCFYRRNMAFVCRIVKCLFNLLVFTLCFLNEIKLSEYILNKISFLGNLSVLLNR